LCLILASLDKTLQLVCVLGKLGFYALARFVLVDELPDGPPDLSREADHLVGGHLRIRGGHHVTLPV
jgi:hypothetical protein